jgi:hypothetical protein
VLAAADVGIAVGSATDLARETADIVLPQGGLRLLPRAIGLSRAVRRTILTNLLGAFGYNAIGLALAVSGHLQPVLAAVLMAASSLLVVVNCGSSGLLSPPMTRRRLRLPRLRRARCGNPRGHRLQRRDRRLACGNDDHRAPLRRRPPPLDVTTPHPSPARASQADCRASIRA